MVDYPKRPLASFRKRLAQNICVGIDTSIYRQYKRFKMKKQLEKQKKAIDLRSSGLPISKISNILKSSKSSISLWVKDIILTDEQKLTIKNRYKLCYKKKYYDDPKKCLYCGEIIPYEKKFNKFCNLRCSCVGRSFNKTRKEKKDCLSCNKKITGYGLKFCCHKCSVNYHWEKRIENVNKTGELPHHQKTAKDIVIKIKGHKCEMCNNTKWRDRPIPLVLDHIDGNCDNWSICNLRLVCGNCDMQLPTYKSKNKNHRNTSRKIYRKKYNE